MIRVIPRDEPSRGDLRTLWIGRETVGASGVSGRENVGVGGASWGGAPRARADKTWAGHAAHARQRYLHLRRPEVSPAVNSQEAFRWRLDRFHLAGRIMSRFFGSSLAGGLNDAGTNRRRERTRTERMETQGRSIELHGGAQGAVGRVRW